MSIFGTFNGAPGGSMAFKPDHPTYGPAVGDSGVEDLIGARGFDGGVHNSPFSGGGGMIKTPFAAPGSYNPFMFMRPRRRRMNMLSIAQCAALPTAIFAAISWLFSFSVHEWMPMWCWFAACFCLVLAVVFAVKAFIVRRKQHEEVWTVPWYLRNDDDTWYLFLAVAVAVSCLAGLALGLFIFGTYTQPYYKLSRLHTYNDVDPVTEGRAYLDAGAIEFKKHSYVSTQQSVGYRDGNTYCVAPIKLGNDLVKDFDFWAAGINCCNGFPGNFNCEQDRADTSARGGLRVIDGGALSYFKLAAMQAGAEFDRTSTNPLFFMWMKDPVQKIESYMHDAVRAYAVGFVAFALLEAAAVALMAYTLWKNKLWG